MVVHYELLLYYAVGGTPRGACKIGYSRGASYRFWKIYREAGKRLLKVLQAGNLGSPAERNRPTNLGEKRSVRRRSSGGKRPKSCKGCAQIWGSKECDTCPDVTGSIEEI